MKKSFVSIVLMVFLLFFAACGVTSRADDEADVNNNYSGESGYDTSDSASYDDGGTYNDSGDYGGANSGNNDYGDTGDAGYYENSDAEAYEGDAGDTGEEEKPSEEPKVGDLIENDWVETKTENTSTFSIDVDTASYTLARNYLMNYDQMPPKDRIRIEEMVNYFDYDYPQPEDGQPFSVTMEMADSPWRSDTKLVMFGLQGKQLAPNEVPAHNLVFLIDVSGSMYGEDRLGLLKKSFKKLVEKLDKDDKVSIVTYAGSAGTLLDSVSGADKDKIIAALDALEAGGSTAGAAGIITAYELAEKNYSSDANNRIILATDGDFNVGASSDTALVSLIEEERDKGIYLTILGFGMGNYQDEKMEQLSNAGNGNYFYVDSEKEADKIFTVDLLGTMFTIAKDVKLQVVFNPEKIAKYRLVGYENRVMANEDFNDDTKDAGEIGAGHRVTAFYEVILTGKKTETETPAETETPEENNDGENTEVSDDETTEISDEETTEISDDEGETPDEDEAPAEVTEPESEFGEDDFLLLKMRYKKPDENKSNYKEFPMTSANVPAKMSPNMGFASAVAEFGMLLRDSKFKADSSYDSVLKRAKDNIGKDTFGFRGEFLEMVSRAKYLDK